jgi:hypothetical protein
VIGNVATGTAGAAVTNPASCLALVSNGVWNNGVAISPWRGDRWPEGNASSTGFCTILPPNSPNCSESTWDGGWGLFSGGSRHTGGMHVLLGDGAVRFVNNSIDTGNKSSPAATSPGTLSVGGRSPYGIWGALGTRASNEPAGEF